jgi:AraC family transcriptional regulator
MTQRQPQDWLKRAEAIIRDRFSESVSLNEVAKTVAIHPVHLARTFRQHYRCSIGEYVRKLRVEFAREAIVTTDCALTDIGMAAGFYDQSHFARTFKHATGLTPSALRAMTRTRSSQAIKSGNRSY